MATALYTPEILRLAVSIPNQQLLPTPDARVERTSPVCGSRVVADVEVDAAGHIMDFGLEVPACALGQAAAAILGQGIMGETGESLRAAHDALAAWLRGDGPLPPLLAARYPQLELLAAARAHPARHASIRLGFDAAAEAASSALAAKLRAGG